MKHAQYLFAVFCVFFFMNCTNKEKHSFVTDFAESESESDLVIQNDYFILENVEQSNIMGKNFLYALKSGKLFVATRAPYVIDISSGTVVQPGYTLTTGVRADKSGNGCVSFWKDPIEIYENSGEGYSYHYMGSYSLTILDHHNYTLQTVALPIDINTIFQSASESLLYKDGLLRLSDYTNDSTIFTWLNQNFEVVEKKELAVGYAEPIAENIYIYLEYDDVESNYDWRVWRIGIFNSETNIKTTFDNNKVIGNTVNPRNHANLYQVIPALKKVVFVTRVIGKKPGIFDVTLRVVSYADFLAH